MSLGHCRLAVIDPRHASQPMLSSPDEERPIALSFGGEIYNYRELRRTLISLGHSFRTESDTEVILRGYIEWGTSMPLRLRGMFSFALWDSREQLLLLVRDPLGIKPLFYYEYSNGVLFSSEPKGLLGHPLVEAAVDREGLAELLGLWPYKSPGHGIYRGVKEVKPGELIVFRRDTTRRTAYWGLRSLRHTDGPKETVARVGQLLDTAISSQLTADVPLAFLLSGGLDSSGLVTIALTHWKKTYPVNTFSLDYEDSERDFVSTPFRPDLDKPYVHDICRFLGTSHTEFVLNSADIHAAEMSALAARDLPDTGDMDASLILLFGRISENFPVCITGEGADELFGGYPWFCEALTSPLQSFPWQPYLCFNRNFIRPDAAAQIDLDEYVAQNFADSVREVERVEGEDLRQHNSRVMSYLDLTRFLPGQLERKDRASMARSVEARVPFCDQDLVEYAWNIPGSMKSCDGIEKGILREALCGSLPDRVRLRRKASYPTLLNVAHEAYLRRQMLRLIADQDWALADVIDTERLSGVLAGDLPAPAARPSVWMGRIWSLYRWCEEYDPRMA